MIEYESPFHATLDEKVAEVKCKEIDDEIKQGLLTKINILYYNAPITIEKTSLKKIISDIRRTKLDDLTIQYLSEVCNSLESL